MKPKRPRDSNQLAKLVVDIATGETQLPESKDTGKNPAAVALGRLGGLKGGDARSKGIPQIGSGKIYITPEEEIEVEPFEIPRSWPRVYSIDPAFRNFTGVVWGAWDRETDAIYIYREFYKNEVLPWQAAYEIKTPHAKPGLKNLQKNKKKK